MLVLQGNIWDFAERHHVAVTTNGIVKRDGTLVMGKGIALEAKQKWPKLPYILGQHVKVNGNRVLYIAEYKLFSFPTKEDYRNNSSLSLIAKSAVELVEICDRFGINTVYLPKPGCGCGNLRWYDVYDVISKILDDRFVVVYDNK